MLYIDRLQRDEFIIRFLFQKLISLQHAGVARHTPLYKRAIEIPRPDFQQKRLAYSYGRNQQRSSGIEPTSEGEVAKNTLKRKL